MTLVLMKALDHVNIDHYPIVLSEEETVVAATTGRSLSRFGDGELRLALGGNAVSQRAEKGLQQELRAILKKSVALACIPNVNSATPLFEKCWRNHSQPKYSALYDQERVYGSAFITRPDSAPWINVPAYWKLMSSLWFDRDCMLVVGADMTSLNPELMQGAKSVLLVRGPRRDAYSSIAQLENEIGPFTAGPIFMCLGATATVLAERLAKKGLWAIDIGNIGKFMPKLDGRLWGNKGK